MASRELVDLADERQRQDVGVVVGECRWGMPMLDKIKNPHMTQILSVLLWSAVPLRLYRPGFGLAILINGCKDALCIHVEEVGEMMTSETGVMACGGGAV